MSSNIYSNLPSSKPTNEVVQVQDSLYNRPFELEVSTLNSMKGFFESKAFDSNAAESISVIIMKQARIDGYNPMQILDTLRGLNEVEISALVSEILNYNRIKTSFLGYARQFNPNGEVLRNIRS